MLRKIQRLLFLLATLLSSTLSLSAQECEYDPCEPCVKSWKRNQLFIGPEVYYARREREGGTHQSGPVIGVRAGYDHIKRYKFYWGGDLLYAWGRLDGKTADSTKIKSNFIDFDVEGRFGYTFQQKCGYQFSFTPYFGYGYAQERNNFIKPSPLLIHSNIFYTYFPVGFLSQMTLSPCWTVGINFKAKFLWDTKNKISHDPENDSLKMLVKNEIHYRVELPATYQYCENVLFSVVPFYEFRKYGNQANYPFNFLETKWNLYGVTLKLIYCL